MYFEHLEARRLFAAGPLDSDAFQPRAPTPAGQHALQDRKLVLSDGRTIIVSDDQNHWRLRAYLPNGTIDKSFGEKGYLDLSRRLASGNARRITFLAEAPDGGLYVGGNGRVRNEKRSEATGTLIAKLNGDGSLDKGFFPKGARDIDRGGFFRLDAQVGSFAFRDVLQVVRGGKVFNGAGGQSNDVMLLRGDAGSGINAGAGGLGVNAPVALNAAGSRNQLPTGLYPTRAIGASDEMPDGSFLVIDYLYDDGPGAGPAVYLIRVSSNGHLFAVRLAQGNDGAAAATGSKFAAVGLEFGDRYKFLTMTRPQAGALSHDIDDLDSASEVAVQPGDDVVAARRPRDARVEDVSGDASNEGVKGHLQDESTGDVQSQTAGGGMTRVFCGGVAIDSGNVEMGHSAASAGIGLVLGNMPIDAHALASIVLGRAADLLSAEGEGSDSDPSDSTVPFDAATHVANPVSGAHGFSWEPIDDVPYLVHLLSNRVGDITGALAVGRTIGSFAVRVPDAPLLGAVTAALREKQQKLAPNT